LFLLHRVGGFFFVRKKLCFFLVHAPRQFFFRKSWFVWLNILASVGSCWWKSLNFSLFCLYKLWIILGARLVGWISVGWTKRRKKFFSPASYTCCSWRLSNKRFSFKLFPETWQYLTPPTTITNQLTMVPQKNAFS